MEQDLAGIVKYITPHNLILGGLFALLSGSLIKSVYASIGEVYHGYHTRKEKRYVDHVNSVAEATLRYAITAGVRTHPLYVWDNLTFLENDPQVRQATREQLKTERKRLYGTFNEILNRDLPQWYEANTIRLERLDLQNRRYETRLDIQAQQLLHEAMNFPYRRNPTELWDELVQLASHDSPDPRLRSHLEQLHRILQASFHDILTGVFSKDFRAKGS